MGRWQDPTLPRIVTSCWKRWPRLLPFAQLGSAPVGEEKCWENPSAPPEGGMDAGRGRWQLGCLGDAREAGQAAAAFTFLLL